jgi:hypothetical protein
MTNIGNSPALNFNFSSSVNTRQFYRTAQFAANATPAPFSSIFQLDPNCPFFRILAAGVGAVTTSYLTSFQFFLGGTPCGGTTFQAWGDDTVYDSSTGPNPASGLLITPFLGDDNIVIHSQFAQGCVIVGSSYSAGDFSGFITRWTALADSVSVTTTPCAGAPAVNAATEIVHGVIQAPW